ncbi:MAG TPA: Hpt domain-containing protein, partial [Kofleriaceae bacterium]
MPDPYRYFRLEASELAEQLDRELVALEARPDGDRVARLLRLAHTLKGAARIVKHPTLADLAHALEDVLAPLRGSGLGELDGAMAIAKEIDAQVAALTPPPDPTAPAPPGSPAPPAPLAPPGPANDTAALPRVDTSLLEHLIGELGELHAQLAGLRGQHDLPALDALDRGLAGARNIAEQLRLLPASSVLGSLERTARDAARATGRPIRFASTGGEVRVDARVLAGLHGALVQLVRNA